MKKRKSAVEILNQRDNNCSSLPNFLKGYISDNLGSKKSTIFLFGKSGINIACTKKLILTNYKSI